MVDSLWGDTDLTDHQIALQVRAWSAELATADASRCAAILESICDLSWKAGPRMAQAIPVLLQWLVSPDTKIEEAVCYSLMNCAPASISPLLEQLRHPSELVRQRASYTLGKIGKTVGDRLYPVADGLIARLEDTSEGVRGKAAFALGLVQDCRQSTVDRLIAMARTDSPSNRASALHAIGNIGRVIAENEARHGQFLSPDGIETVRVALGDPDEDVRHSACHALEIAGLHAEEHFSRIMRILEWDPSATVQILAASQLPMLAKQHDLSAETAKLAFFLDRDFRIASEICETLGKIGPRAKAAVPALLQTLEAESDLLALQAAQALWRIERHADHVLPVLDRLFEANGEFVCDIACELGTAARPLLPRLLTALATDDYWDLQWAAADAVGCVASADPETMQALKTALTHDSGIVCSAAANALGKIGEPAVPLLVEMLHEDRYEKAQEWVAHALARIGPPALVAAPLLRTKLRSRQRGLRRWSAIALAKVASDADAVPALLEILGDDELADIWNVACDAIAVIGPAAGASRNHLMALAAYPIDEVQAAAKLAIEAIDRPSN